MLMSGILFVLILAGCWVYCLIDAALTPNAVFRGLPKAAWIGIIATTFILGGIAWLCYRATLRFRPRLGTPGVAPGFTRRSRVLRTHAYIYRHPDWAAAEIAFARHPAGRFRNTPPGRRARSRNPRSYRALPPVPAHPGGYPPEPPGGWSRPIGPDDDPDFLAELDRRIKGADPE